jgi:CDP-paratose 2-epimerase
VSLRQLLRHLEHLVGRPVRTEFLDWRAGDQKYYVSDIRRAAAELHLPPPRPWQEGVRQLVQWLAASREITGDAPVGAALETAS